MGFGIGENGMICPQCKFENQEGMRFCGMCGNKLITLQHEKEKLSFDKFHFKVNPYLLFGIIIAVIIMTLIIGISLSGDSDDSITPDNIEINLTYSIIDVRETVPNSPIVVIVMGDIWNYNEKDFSGTVRISVYDGWEWHYYSEPTGLLKKNGEVGVWFEWSNLYHHFDPEKAQVTIAVYNAS